MVWYSVDAVDDFIKIQRQKNFLRISDGYYDNPVDQTTALLREYLNDYKKRHYGL